MVVDEPIPSLFFSALLPLHFISLPLRHRYSDQEIGGRRVKHALYVCASLVAVTGLKDQKETVLWACLAPPRVYDQGRRDQDCVPPDSELCQATDRVT